jgi:predicted HTH domain antitoxin
MSGLRLDPRDFVSARLSSSEDEVVQDALRHLIEDRPDLRVALAVDLYRRDEGLTMASAAHLAGVPLWKMLEILDEHGVEPRFGPQTLDEARADVATARRLLNDCAG